MQPKDLEQYLHEHIPLSRAMGVSAVAVEPSSVVLRAPLAPNINHFDTVFGGSASALAILASWSLIQVCLRREGIVSRLVIQRNTMDYERPVRGEFTASAALEQPESWPVFVRALSRRGKARISVVSILREADEASGRFMGEYVALGRLPP